MYIQRIYIDRFHKSPEQTRSLMIDAYILYWIDEFLGIICSCNRCIVLFDQQTNCHIGKRHTFSILDMAYPRSLTWNVSSWCIMIILNPFAFVFSSLFCRHNLFLIIHVCINFFCLFYLMNISPFTMVVFILYDRYIRRYIRTFI